MHKLQSRVFYASMTTHMYTSIMTADSQLLFVCLYTPPGDKDGKRVTTVLATVGKPPDRQQEISYCDIKAIGNGSFGVVYQARLLETNESVAIKKVLQDKRFKNRELQIMRRLDHCNIIRLQYFFYSNGDKVSSNTCL